MHIVDQRKKKSNGSSRSFGKRPHSAPLPKVDLGDSIIELEARPASTPSAARPRLASPHRLDPLRLIGAASLGLGAVCLVLWMLGTILATGGPTELQRFNAGRPVMLCTAGGYRSVDDSLLGRVFGERHFTCRDWKMGP